MILTQVARWYSYYNFALESSTTKNKNVKILFNFVNMEV